MADESSKDQKARSRLEQIKRQSRRNVTAQEAQIDALVAQLEQFLERNLSRILEGLRTDKVTAREAARALGGLEAAMEEAGLQTYFEKAKALFRNEYDAVTDAFQDTTGKAATLSGFALKNLDTLVENRLAIAASFVTDYIGDVRAAVLDAVVGGRKVNPRELFAQAEGRTLANLKTELNTALMAYQQVVHMEKAEKAGIELFLYVGPDDEVTRPFCVEHVDRIFTRQEIEAMDNGQDLPVMIYRGGYNCRHHWRPVSNELAESLEPRLAERRQRNADARAEREAAKEAKRRRKAQGTPPASK
jgi:hypothetical protein